MRRLRCPKCGYRPPRGYGAMILCPFDGKILERVRFESLSCEIDHLDTEAAVVRRVRWRCHGGRWKKAVLCRYCRAAWRRSAGRVVEVIPLAEVKA